MIKGQMPTEELWQLFSDYEERAHSAVGAPEYRIAAATMANAIARIIAAREGSRYDSA